MDVMEKPSWEQPITTEDVVNPQPKIETCEGTAGIVDVLPVITYRGRKIVLRVRDLTDEESYEIDNMVTQAQERFIKSGSKPKEIEIEGKPVLTSMSTEDAVEISDTTTAYRLGAKERILNEGWQGITPALIPDKTKRPRGVKANDLLPVTLENYLALPIRLRTVIGNLIYDHFKVSVEAELKNSNGR